ncbi:hypothetical protein [Nocardia sp. NPDC057030]|uniref:hypothetical protein n=1 Tax=unclassified Nocardia TaxID=2637762 RepID=UPI00362BC583
MSPNVPQPDRVFEDCVVDYVRMNAEIVDQSAHGRPEWQFRSAYHLLLQHGRFFTARSRPPQVPKMPDGFCYRNAAHTAESHPELGLVYTEGFAFHILPVQHAWCVSPDGIVVDPTWEEPGCAYFGVAVADRSLWPTGGGGLLSDIDRCLPLLRSGIPGSALAGLGRTI